jgi:hypothetical protein
MGWKPIAIEVFETLDAIDRHGSFAKAAEELNKSTAAVSHVVQKLEEQLDIALFQRQGAPYLHRCRVLSTVIGVFSELREFLKENPTIESDICESVLNGGWEAREQSRRLLSMSCYSSPGFDLPIMSRWESVEPEQPRKVLQVRRVSRWFLGARLYGKSKNG